MGAKQTVMAVDAALTGVGAPRSVSSHRTGQSDVCVNAQYANQSGICCRN